MLQRIQSVYLFLAFAGLILTFFFPFASFYSDLAYYRFSITGFHHIHPDPTPVFNWLFAFPLWLLDLVTAVMLLTITFSYRDRIRQLKLLRISLLINIVFIALVFYYAEYLIEQKLGLSPHYRGSTGLYFPIAAVFFQILATRAIRKDETLVRSANRLR